MIKHNSDDTIYKQIVSQIKMLIAKDELNIGESLPNLLEN